MVGIVLCRQSVSVIAAAPVELVGVSGVCVCLCECLLVCCVVLRPYIQNIKLKIYFEKNTLGKLLLG